MQEQIALCDWLRLHGVLFAHPPNEGRRSRRQGALLRKAGLSSGLPDLLVFTPPPSDPSIRGVAIELKRRNGRMSQVSDNQASWLAQLASAGWCASVAFGAADAIEQLQKLGYGICPKKQG